MNRDLESDKRAVGFLPRDWIMDLYLQGDWVLVTGSPWVREVWVYP